MPDESKQNYLSGVELITPTGKLTYNKDVGGRRGRTAMALTPDSLILYCSGDGTKDASTPESLKEELAAYGATSALMLDGGGSSQCDLDGEKITSSRIVYNHILIYRKGNTGTTTDNTTKIKDIQKALNTKYDLGLAINGSFGPASQKAFPNIKSVTKITWRGLFKLP